MGTSLGSEATGRAHAAGLSTDEVLLWSTPLGAEVCTGTCLRGSAAAVSVSTARAPSAVASLRPETNAGPRTRGLADLHVAGLNPAFDPAVTEYTIHASAASAVDVTASLGAPADRLQVAGGGVASGQTVNVWAPPGGGFDVAAYRGWVEIGHYHVSVLP